jgi:lysophospholipase L1-like esterase
LSIPGSGRRGSDLFIRATRVREDGGVTALRYVALGDSYTIGTSVAEAERWPNQLVARLPDALELTANLAANGFAASDVIARELPRLDALRPEFLSLLVGVNDVVRGVPLATFGRQATAILDDLVGRVGPARIVVVATPDYTVTPAGADYGDPRRQSAGILAANTVLRRLAEDRGMAWVDIYDVSLEAAADRSLVARDGLHPSGAQYTRWVDRIEPVVRALLAVP